VQLAFDVDQLEQPVVAERIQQAGNVDSSDAWGAVPAGALILSSAGAGRL